MKTAPFLRTLIEPRCHSIPAGFGFFYVKGLAKDAVPTGFFGFIKQLVSLSEHLPQRIS